MRALAYNPVKTLSIICLKVDLIEHCGFKTFTIKQTRRLW